MIKAIINGIFKLILSLVNLLLLPIDSLIAQFMPDISELLDYVSNFFSLIGDFIPFVASYFGLNKIVLMGIYNITVFILTVPILVSTIKLAITWYDKLKV